MTVLNADSVYVVTMTTLLLNLRLSTDGYYESENKDKITMTEVGSLLYRHFEGIWKGVLMLNGTWNGECDLFVK